MSDKFNVLVVEDDEKTYKTLKEGLEDNACKIWRVTAGKEVFSLLKNSYFPIVITEIQIADMSGIELIKKIKKIDNKISVVAITSSFAESRVSALKAGAYAYLPKPLNKEEVKVILRRAVENTCLLIQAGKRKYYQDMSILDGLTGVYNHRHFYQMLDWQIDHLERFPQAFSMFMIDIDDFKKYNDTKGHPEGDKVLCGAARLFVNLLRENDMVFRYGGEEFAIILPQTKGQDAEKAGERLIKRVRDTLPVTVSVGLATFPDNAQTKVELVAKADKALYRAKAQGKDRLCVYEKLNTARLY